MATYYITAFAPADATNLTTPGYAGAFPVTGDEYRLRPDWSNSTHALTITVTDNDGTLSGDPKESGVEVPNLEADLRRKLHPDRDHGQAVRRLDEKE